MLIITPRLAIKTLNQVLRDFKGVIVCLIYLKYTFVINLIEDCAVDLIGLQGRPVKHRQAELGLDGLLNSDCCKTQTCVNFCSASCSRIE